jgi:DNA-binding response OmpR family regulator
VLHKRGYRGGVIMLTAKGLEEARCSGSISAPMTTCKPLKLELVARMRHRAAAAQHADAATTHFADVSIDRRARQSSPRQ